MSSDLASLRIDRTENPDRKSPARFLVYAAIAAAVIAAVYYVALPYVRAKVFKTEVATTEIVMVSPTQASVELNATGYVVPQVISRVAAKVPGKVSEVKVRQGDTVKAGDVLFKLEISDQKAAIAAAQSKVAAAYARVQTARANLAETQLQAKRAAELSAKGVAPKSRAQDLKARAASLRAQVRAANAEVRAAQAEVRALRVSTSSYTVKAPINGTVVNKTPEVGELVGPGAVSASGGTINLADFTTLVIETDVPEGRLHMVKIGGPTEIALDAFPNKRYRGKTKEIVPKVNRAKATVTIKVAFVDSPDGVLPDMSARVSFLTKELDAKSIKEPPKKVVPASAVVERNGAKVVFVVDDGRVRMKTVTVGAPYGDGFELRQGPPADTRVVKNPPPDLKDGQAVKLTGD